MSTSPTPSSSSIRSRKVVIPKVWKRPHSTIYGKNVEFGSSLYSDKIGELNGRKFNSELPWSMRQRNSGTNSSSAGTNSSTSSTSSGTYSQGYLSNLLLVDSNDPLLNHLFGSNKSRYHNHYLSAQQNRSGSNNSSSSSGGNYHSSNDNYANMLELTNPARISKRNNQRKEASKQSMLNNNSPFTTTTTTTTTSSSNKRIDFYDQYKDFDDEINHIKNSSLLYNEPLLTRKVLNDFLDFDYDSGLFVPNHYNSRADRSLIRRSTYSKDYNNSDINSNYLYCPNTNTVPSSSSSSSSSSSNYKFNDHSNHITHRNTIPIPTPPNITSTKLLPKHECQLISSPYGQSNDGRKLSLGSINPHSYRPSLPQKTTTAHASDGEEFEFQDKSSPFYTDR